LTGLPQLFGFAQGIDVEPRPPILFVAGVVLGPVMYVAQRHGPFVAGLAAHGARLGVPDVVRLGGCSGADHAGQAGDELEMVLVAHAAWLGEVRPSSVSITKSWIITDRDRGIDERARAHGRGALFRWRAPLVSPVLKDNHMVNLDAWSTNEAEKGDVAIADYSDQNHLCPDRAARGLTQDQVPNVGSD